MLSTLSLTTACIWLLTTASYSFAPLPAPARFEYSQAHMGTRFKIILYSSDSRLAGRAASDAFDRVARLDAIMSDYSETSELSLLAKRPAGQPVPISEELFRVLAHAERLARRTDGAFDVTSGPIVRLWRRARRTGEMPDSARLARALELSGYEKLHLDEKSRTATLKRSGMVLDLGGIAKGFAADEAIRVLKRRGIHSALVAAGGDIVVSGPPPRSRGWAIAVAALDLKDANAPRALLLANAAVSTSGDAEQHVEIDGARYSHIIDPRTGMPVTGHSSVTVVAADGVTADSLATAASVLGPERGLKLVDDTPGAAALFMRAAESGLLCFESKRWGSVAKMEASRAIGAAPAFE